jgi:hypothetical protein
MFYSYLRRLKIFSVIHRLFPLLFLIPLTSFSQQRYTHQLFWLRLTFGDTINEKLEWEFGIQRRTQNNYTGDPNLFHSFQFEGYSPTLKYNFSEKFNVSVMPLGYYRSHVLNVQQTDWLRPSTTEWRSTVQVGYETDVRYFTFLNRLSMDYRRRGFQGADHDQNNWRMRYMVRIEKEVFGIFSHVKPVTFTIFDEVFFQFGDAVKDNHYFFDRNRLYFGAAYEILRNTTFSIGYAYGFQMRPSGDQCDNINSLYVAVAFDNLFSQFSRPTSNY